MASMQELRHATLKYKRRTAEVTASTQLREYCVGFILLVIFVPIGIWALMHTAILLIVTCFFAVAAGLSYCVSALTRDIPDELNHV
jgi:heme/copper-type cytochrome/quinol oxidase subunit 4